jgi:uncharacterized membrane protein
MTNTPQENTDVERVLASLPKEKREEVISIAMSYQGPIMPPHLLQKIENIIPGGAERVLRLSEKEQTHRHEMTDIQIKTAARQTKASLIAGVAAFALLVIGILYCAINGYTAGVGALGCIGAFGVITHIIRLPKSDKGTPSN